MIRDVYRPTDFDFALVYLDDIDLFYIFPVDVFIGYGSEIHIVVADKRQRKPKSANYCDAWNLILQWAAHGETRVRNLSNSGEPVAVAIPSQAPMLSCESRK